ncbi:uncharacterized protein KD926_000621 [Aspergillus affinis]|uniref:uncharacterized protein n=1 Tax=Aspergillus affinis TaxID=1070780 RepID=UPI0022FDF114|nr:uncharacterized protein KD926_000621 [Aspergillus affinis]KAI9037334.1 hypothetical protein KD926_000621 [Aspergillus affinis]
MLREEGSTRAQVDWVPVPPNSSLAFDTLLKFCSSEGLQAECLIGLASVLLLTSVAGDLPPPKFAPPVSIPDIPTRPSQRQEQDMIFQELFQSIDKCMFLSSTRGALESLLCSAFFDPSVSCNLPGAASLGIRKAISTANTVDSEQLLNAITYMRPHLSLLWNAAICNDQANALLNMALKGLPPICLVAGFLTDTNQSFLQIDYHDYHVKHLGNSQVSRAKEFQTSFFCRPDISVPWSPAPPFGATTVQNLSLEDSNLCGSYCVDQDNELPDAKRDLADEQSGEATSRLFNWHRGYDNGLWLDEGDGDVELIRKLQTHAWIIDPYMG